MREQKRLASAMAGTPAYRDHSKTSRKKQRKLLLVFAALYRGLFHVSALCQWPHITIQSTAPKAIECWLTLRGFPQSFSTHPQEKTLTRFTASCTEATGGSGLILLSITWGYAQKNPSRIHWAWSRLAHQLLFAIPTASGSPKACSTGTGQQFPHWFYISPGNGTFPVHPGRAAAPSCQHSPYRHWLTNHARWPVTRNCSRTWTASGYPWHRRQP